MSNNEKKKNQEFQRIKPQRPRVVLISLDQLRDRELSSNPDWDYSEELNDPNYENWPSDQELNFHLETVPTSPEDFTDEIDEEEYSDGGGTEVGL